MKDDNLGLGAKRGNAKGETFGLDGLQALLGRLNGKSEEALQKEEEARRDVKLAMYQERRFGGMRFVSGGFLEGDNIEQAAREHAEGPQTDPLSTNAPSDVDPPSRKRKRKKMEPLDTPPSSTPVADKSCKRRESERSCDVQKAESKKGKRRKLPASLELNSNMEDTGQCGLSAQTPPATQKREAASDTVEIKMDRRRNVEKKAGKEAKQLPSIKNLEKQAGAEILDNEAAALETAAKAGRDSSDREVAPIPARGRHLVRQRYIQQKRMASTDEQALREVSIALFQHVHFLC